MKELIQAKLSQGRSRQLGLLVLLLLLAALVRCIGFETVFLDDGTVVFANSDAFYHARRALYTLAHFPDLLRFDPCINYPDGASVPHAPGYDFAVAALSRMLGGSLETFERTSAWLPVGLGALGVLPVFTLGRMLAGRAVGFGAATLYALLPIAVNYSRVGNADHHAAAGLLGAWLLALYSAVLGEGSAKRSTGRLVWLFSVLLFTRVAMLLTWHGSLLYLGVGELALLLLAVARGRRDLLTGQALTCLCVAALLVPVVASGVTPTGGLWTATELSRLHVLLFASDALICAVLGALLRRDVLESAVQRLLAAAFSCAVVGGMSLLIPGVLDALLAALGFLTKSDEWGASVLEQLPLFYESGVLDPQAGEKWLGGMAYLLALIPLAFVPLLEQREQRARATLLIAWTLIFGALAFSQVRYANDYAASGCVGTALLIAHAAGWVSARTSRSARLPLALLGGLVVLAPIWPRYYSIVLEPTLAHLQSGARPIDRALVSLEGTQLRFAQAVRRNTPEVVGCGLEPGRPDYGILAHPAIGHVLHYVARRATPVDPFGPYIGRANYDQLRRALRSTSEREVLEIAQRLQARYVLSADDASSLAAGNVMRRLHRDDGSAQGSLPHLGHFRLITEGPDGGVALARLFDQHPGETTPYKLFEIVAGAVLEVPSAPGREVSAVLPVRIEGGRHFSFRAHGVAGPDGLARLRVPYATDGAEREAAGRYTVVAGRRRWQVEVSDAAVREGRSVRVGASSGRTRRPRAAPTDA